MDEKSNASEVIKKYTRELRSLLENEKLLAFNELKLLQDKYVLTKDEIDKVEDFANIFYEKAKSDYDFGNWDSAIENIEEASYKSPFNTEILILYCMISLERSKLYEEKNNTKHFEIELKRLQQVDKNEYKKIKKIINKNNPKKINKLWFLLILLLLPLIFFYINNNEKTTDFVKIEKPMRILLNGEIAVDIINKAHPSNPEIKVIKSKLQKSKDNSLYILQFYISSKKDNIIAANGDITWMDKNNIAIYNEGFSIPRNIEYYINENIPISYSKSSLSGSLNLSKVVLKINEISTMPGKRRENLSSVEFSLPHDHSWDMTIDQVEYHITKGVVSDYLTLSLRINNNGSKDMSELIGKIEWMDDYNIVTSSSNLNFLTVNNVPIEKKDNRIIYKTFELNGKTTSEYKITISRIR